MRQPTEQHTGLEELGLAENMGMYFERRDTSGSGDVSHGIQIAPSSAGHDPDIGWSMAHVYPIESHYIHMTPHKRQLLTDRRSKLISLLRLIDMELRRYSDVTATPNRPARVWFSNAEDSWPIPEKSLVGRDYAGTSHWDFHSILGRPMTVTVADLILDHAQHGLDGYTVSNPEVQSELKNFAEGVDGAKPCSFVVHMAYQLSEAVLKTVDVPDITLDVDGELSFYLRLKNGHLMMAELSVTGIIDASIYDEDDKLVRRMRRASVEEITSALGV